ncbi:serine carboxypeptidase S28 [Cooperia oncophora]
MNILDQFAEAVQYSGDNTPRHASGYGIPEMCKIMQQSEDPVSKIAQFVDYMKNMTTSKQDSNEINRGSYNDYVAEARMSKDEEDQSAYLWMYQTCFEFGFFQSTDSGHNIFGSPLPLNFFTRTCSEFFPDRYSAVENQQSVLKTNHHYGGRHKYEAENVVMTHGSLDPWHALGNETCDSSRNCFVIKGTAHCADMYPARKEDPKELTDTRNKVEEIIRNWLAPPTPINVDMGNIIFLQLTLTRAPHRPQSN